MATLLPEKESPALAGQMLGTIGVLGIILFRHGFFSWPPRVIPGTHIILCRILPGSMPLFLIPRVPG